MSMKTTGYLSPVSISWAKYTVVVHVLLTHCCTYATLDDQAKTHAAHVLYDTTAQHGFGTGSEPGFMNPYEGSYPSTPMHPLDSYPYIPKKDGNVVDKADGRALPSMQLYTPIPAFFSLWIYGYMDMWIYG